MIRPWRCWDARSKIACNNAARNFRRRVSLLGVFACPPWEDWEGIYLWRWTLTMMLHNVALQFPWNHHFTNICWSILWSIATVDDAIPHLFSNSRAFCSTNSGADCRSSAPTPRVSPFARFDSSGSLEQRGVQRGVRLIKSQNSNEFYRILRKSFHFLFKTKSFFHIVI